MQAFARVSSDGVCGVHTREPRQPGGLSRRQCQLLAARSEGSRCPVFSDRLGAACCYTATTDCLHTVHVCNCDPSRVHPAPQLHIYGLTVHTVATSSHTHDHQCTPPRVGLGWGAAPAAPYKCMPLRKHAAANAPLEPPTYNQHTAHAHTCHAMNHRRIYQCMQMGGSLGPRPSAPHACVTMATRMATTSLNPEP